MVLCLTVQEDLKPPIAVFVEPTEKNEKFCFGEDKESVKKRLEGEMETGNYIPKEIGNDHAKQTGLAAGDFKKLVFCIQEKFTKTLDDMIQQQTVSTENLWILGSSQEFLHDPLELCCDNAASIKQEEGLFTEVSGAASSAGTSNEAAAGCVSDEEIHGSHRHLCIHAENEHGPDSIEEIARDDITFICDVSPLHRTMCSRFPKASGVRCQYPGRDL
ncbi:Protein of unknown function [Gryllus bimaculatus]|nr:Protein of unknown function [Gryllus bimaculatus]